MKDDKLIRDNVIGTSSSLNNMSTKTLEGELEPIKNTKKEDKDRLPLTQSNYIETQKYD